ncbi:5' nucleotidase, NT5C type [Bacillus suaedaesalsae]|uniref:5'(3')-deoxyribonucleotidase n=1 Tax=Bacillus suaedaesalsae TaxID=2810349 RepID=A0ABS2DJY3_9BACI|nr:5'(3')-deoxyribonucleotidase [Bacillus suaedaesalsae]MBM6618717.1 5'(3')-deoxyribonucleotidase [Bacillus suaedaesalsae]
MATILLDMDSVICDLMTDWHKKYNEEYQDSLTVENLKCWKSEKYVKPECGMKIYDYLTEPGLFLNLKPLPNAKEVIERLSQKHELLIVTSSVSTAFAEKELWINEHLPIIGKENMIFTHKKDKVCGDLLFDDAPHNLHSFQATGRIAIAMDYPYNRMVNVPRVKNWLEFERGIIENWWGIKQ